MSANKQAQARDLKQRVLTCLHKLSDRDTHNAAASELEFIAKTLSSDALPPFLSIISATDSSDKSPVRRHCLRLISVLSENHGNSLSPHLSKLLSAVARRLRDPDSSVRSACVAASSSVAAHLTSPPFTSIAKPFLESLYTEQDTNAQNGAALCLAAVVDGSRDPDPGSLRRMLPRFEKLAKCEGFKAKPAILALMASVVGVKGVLSGRSNVIQNLVGCLMEFLSSEDWAARKAAAEALIKIAEVERDALSDYKASCLTTFEAKRFDKVKATRETMNQMIDVWKVIPDLSDEVLPPRESQASCKDASNGRNLPGFTTSIGSCTPHVKKRYPLDYPASSTPLADISASTTRKRNPVGGNVNTKGTAMFRKLDHKKHSNRKAESAAAPISSSGTIISEDDNSLDGDGRVLKKGGKEQKSLKPGIRRALFDENHEKIKLGVVKNGSRVVPCAEASIGVSNESGDIIGNRRESEDLSLIHKQLVHIENQQSNLFDLLQRYIGSSQNGMLSLEARVHGLELALDEISFDLAVSNGRMSQDAAMCCKLPGTDLFSSKLLRKTESHIPAASRTPSATAFPNKNGDAECFPSKHHRYRFQGGRGLVTNPLAEIPRGSHGLSEASSSGIVKNISV